MVAGCCDTRFRPNAILRDVYDERDLDDVIGVLARVVSDNRMAPRDRDILTDDLSRLRDYREHHADWDR